MKKSKICMDCKVEKPLTQYYSRGVSTYLKSECKECTKIRVLAWCTKNRKRFQKYQREWHRAYYLKQKNAA